ncbi:hypothetical protein ACFPT7_02270 [Acidicapsa dinghuensis]|uniref:Ribbon-helix-helix protein, CopG family n=1 Tax=Acidicapsa dinghuensis TaxID=2218256 RepID=A0ABW1EA17_9BACT|nr:hypothetical protein [Acidicapsa dinghuensis]
MAKAKTPPPKQPGVTVHSKLSPEIVEQLDKIAASNSITRAAAIAIAVSRLIKTGI